MIFAFFCGHQINLGRIFSCQISFINLLCPVLATCLAAKEILSDSAFSVQHSDFYNLTVFKNYHHDPFRVGITAPRLEDLPLMAHLGGEIVLRRSLRSDLI